MALGHTDSFVVAALLFMLDGAMETARSLLTSYFMAFDEPATAPTIAAGVASAASAAAADPATAAATANSGGASEASASVFSALPRPSSFSPLALYVLYLTQVRRPRQILTPLHLSFCYNYRSSIPSYSS